MSGFESLREEIRRRVDLVTVVSEHVELRRLGREFKGLCPFHQEKTPSFHVNPEKGFFHCHGCHTGGDLFKFVQLREKVTFPEALRLLADRAGVDLSAYRMGGQGQSARADIYRINEWAAKYFLQQLLHPHDGQSAREYLEKRRISTEIGNQFQVGLALDRTGVLQRAAYAAGFKDEALIKADLIRESERGTGYYDTFRDRLMFPIRDSSRRCLGFGGRTLVDAQAKYLNSGQTDVFDKSGTLFGLDVARDAIGKTKRVVMVEGYMDCLAAHQLGVPETVATLGTAATERHMEILRRYCDEAILLFDSDHAGENAADRALQLALQYGLQVRVAKVPDGKDPADFLWVGGPGEFGDLLKSATDALEFKWQRTLARYESSLGGKSRHEAITEFVSVVAGAAHFGAVDSIQRGLIANQVAKLLALPPGEVLAMLSKGVRKAGSTAERRKETQEEGKPESVAPASAEQSALRMIMEVLLADASLWPIVGPVFDPERMEEPTLRLVGQRLGEIARRADRLPADVVEQLLLATDDLKQAGLITELASAGECLPNREYILHGAVEALKQADAVRKRNTIAETVMKLGEGGPLNPESREGELVVQLAQMNESLTPSRRESPAGSGFAPALVPPSWR